MSLSAHLTAEDTPEAAALATRMQRYYETEPGYAAFEQVNSHPAQWEHVRTAIDAVLQRKPRCRVLEVGAGLSGFSTFLADRREAVHYTVQDVTRCNESYLAGVADAVEFGRRAATGGEAFDVIFSTFVFEHIADPRRSLEELFEALEPGGSLFLFCPRYDMPFYLSHSADHYGPARRTLISLFLFGARLWTTLSGRPRFFIHTDPALFHLPWSRDRDAIHWVSLADVRAFFRSRARVERLGIPSHGTKDWIVKHLLQLNVRIIKRDV